MRVEPKSEKDIAQANLYQPGVYDFEVIGSEEKVSKSGNEMIVVKLRIYDGSGGSRFVDDYLLNMESMAFKLRHISEACGLLSDYENGSLQAESFIGKSGKAKIKIQISKDPQYGDKNVVADYVVEVKPKETLDQALSDSDIPF